MLPSKEIDERRSEYIRNKMKVFGMKKIQEALTVLAVMDSSGITIRELLEYKSSYLKSLKSGLKMPSWWPPPKKSRDRKAWLKTLTSSEKEEYRKWRKARLAHTNFGRKKP